MKEAIRRGFEINPTDKNQYTQLMEKAVERVKQTYDWLPYLNKKEEVRLFFKAADLKNDLIWLRMFYKKSLSLERLEMKII